MSSANRGQFGPLCPGDAAVLWSVCRVRGASEHIAERMRHRVAMPCRVVAGAHRAEAGFSDGLHTDEAPLFPMPPQVRASDPMPARD